MSIETFSAGTFFCDELLWKVANFGMRVKIEVIEGLVVFQPFEITAEVDSEPQGSYLISRAGDK